MSRVTPGLTISGDCRPIYRERRRERISRDRITADTRLREDIMFQRSFGFG